MVSKRELRRNFQAVSKANSSPLSDNIGRMTFINPDAYLEDDDLHFEEDPTYGYRLRSSASGSRLDPSVTREGFTKLIGEYILLGITYKELFQQLWNRNWYDDGVLPEMVIEAKQLCEHAANGNWQESDLQRSLFDRFLSHEFDWGPRPEDDFPPIRSRDYLQ